MLTIVTPATTTALTTVERACSMLVLTAPADIAAVTLAIPQVSQTIVDYCRRPFAAETVREVFRQASGAGVLLGRSPATAIVSVTEGENVLLADEFEYDATTGLLYRLSGLYRAGWTCAPLAVEYTAGFTLPAASGSWTLPAAVERAAVLLIGTIVSARERDPLMRSEEIPGVRSVSWSVPDGKGLASSEAELLLEPYRRIVG